MASKYDGLAQIIIQNVGGKGNIDSLTHCVTRLRFRLKDEGLANTNILKETDGIVTVMKSAGQYQVVIGNHVGDVYDAVMDHAGLSTASAAGAPGEKMSPGAAFIDMIAGIFQPMLSYLCAAGILKGLLALAAFLVPSFEGTGAYMVWYSVADGFFAFLPVVLGYNAAKKFGGSRWLGMSIGFGLCYSGITAMAGAEAIGSILGGTQFEMSYSSTFFGIPIVMPSSAGYMSTVIPVIASVYVAVKIENKFREIIPDVVKSFLAPLFTFIIAMPLTFLIIGPVTSLLGGLIGAVLGSLFNIPVVGGLLEGLLLGAFWQVLVMFGVHWGLVPIAMINYATMGYDQFLSPYFVVSFAQTFTVLAIIFKTKDKQLRDVAIPAFISGLFGVTEPAIYGVTLPKKKPFVISCIGGAAGGAFVGLMGTKSFMMGGLGLFGLPSYIGEGSINNMIYEVIGIAIASVVAFVLTLVTYWDGKESKDKEDENKPVVAKGAALANDNTDLKGGIVVSPAEGDSIPLSEVPDEAFASCALGQGAAIMPTVGKIFAPADGELTTFFPTGHAIGMKTSDGAEILMHIGINTVELNGKGFTPKCEQGDFVQKGELLLEFDIDAIKEAGYSVATPVVITNTDQYGQVRMVAHGAVKAGDNLISLVL